MSVRADQLPAGAGESTGGRGTGGLIAMPAGMVTIDSESTRDIDDAFWVETSEEEHRVVVCITDVTKLVQPGSTEDENARLLGATVYVRDSAVRKMLPGHISEGRGSLLEGKDRHCFVFEIVMDADLELKRFLIERRMARVSKRLSYESVAKILRDESHELYGMLSAAATLSHKLLAKRRKSGGMALYDLARLLYTDEDGRLLQLARRDQVLGNVIVQEMMILTNTLAAGHMVAHEIPGIFRNHAAKPAAPASDELVTTIETWLGSATMDVDEVQKTFAVLMGKAAYGASVTGHYALAQPFYGHFTSPLRRYADLANQFQLKAFLKGMPVPRSKEELEALATHLNEKAEDRKEERSEGFKDAVKRHAAKAMDRGDLSRLADHEMVQAIKMAAADGELPDVLVDELVARFERSLATDKVTDCLLVVVGVDLWAPRLREAFSSWLRLIPTRAVHLLMHAEQTGFVEKAEISATGDGTDFEGKVTVTRRGADQAVFTARASRKKDAEQRASTKAVLWLVGCEAGPDDASGSGVAEAQRPAGNPKGAVLEMCAKNGWPSPAFTSSGHGPSHAMVFSAKVEFTNGSVRHTLTAEGAANKKDAEAMVSAQLLAVLRAEAHKKEIQPEAAPARNDGASQPTRAETANAVGWLQEQAQKKKWPLPEYTFKTISEVPPRFLATVVVYGSKPGRYQGEASSKQEAKKKAAEAAVKGSSC